MEIDLHPNMECLLDLSDRAVDVHEQPIRWRVSYGKTVGFGEGHYSLVILLGGAKPFGELRHGQKLVIVGTAGVVETIQKTGQVALVSQRQHDGEVQALCGWKDTHRHRLTAGNGGAYVIMQQLQRLLGVSQDCEHQEHRCADERSPSWQKASIFAHGFSPLRFS